MKNNYLSLFILSLFFIGFTACQSDSTEEQNAKDGMASVSFQILNYEQVCLDEVTRATQLSDLKHLDMAIYDATSNELIDCQQLVPTSDNYGQFSATLPYGDYRFVFLGYEGSRTAHLDTPSNIYFDDSYVPDFFFRTLVLTLSESSEEETPVTLQRAVAAFRLKSEGDIPSSLNLLTFASKGGSYHFNALTGTGTGAEERSYTYNVSSYAGKSSITIYYYTFLPATEATMDFTVTANDKEGGVLQTRNFNEVPMKVNQLTTYSGDFFGQPEAALNFNLSLSGEEWEEKNCTY